MLKTKLDRKLATITPEFPRSRSAVHHTQRVADNFFETPKIEIERKKVRHVADFLISGSRSRIDFVTMEACI